MMVIRSLADFNGAPWAVWSMARHRHRHRPGLHAPARHDEQGVGTFTWPPAGTSSWPPAGTFSWPWTSACDTSDDHFRLVVNDSESSRCWIVLSDVVADSLGSLR